MKREKWFLVGLICAAGAGGGASAEPSNDGASLQLWIRGGPSAVDVQIELNGEPLATVFDDSEPYIELEDKLKEGLNELSIRLMAASEPRAGKQMKLIVAPVQELSESRSRASSVVAMVVVPQDAKPTGDCVEKVFLSYGETPSTAPLSKTYYLASSGPPAAHRVTVSVNERPVVSTNMPVPLMKLNSMLTEGKNTVTFDAQPSCFHDSVSSEDPLTLLVSSGAVEGEKVQLDHPIASFSVDAKHAPKPLKKTFRAK